MFIIFIVEWATGLIGAFFKEMFSIGKNRWTLWFSLPMPFILGLGYLDVFPIQIGIGYAVFTIILMIVISSDTGTWRWS